MKNKKSKELGKREVMRKNNDIARDYLIDSGFEEIWLKPHTRFLDTVWMKDVGADKRQVLKYKAQDLWNCFDGIAWFCGKPVFLAIGQQFKKIEVIEKFIDKKSGFDVLMLKINRKKETVETKVWRK